jgi:hypothetical protein
MKMPEPMTVPMTIMIKSFKLNVRLSCWVMLPPRVWGNRFQGAVRVNESGELADQSKKDFRNFLFIRWGNSFVQVFNFEILSR